MINKINKAWRVIYVASRNEKKVAMQLEEKNIDNYLPLIKTVRQWSDRKKTVELPLLNSYVFVNVVPEEHEEVMRTKCFVNFLRLEGKIAKVSQEEIDRLKQLIELGYTIEARPYNTKHKAGDKIKVSSGPLKGMEGVITRVHGEKYFEVALENIHQNVRVKLPSEILI